MSVLDLKATYRKTKSSQAVNAAIRAEIPAGNFVVDCMSKWENELFRSTDAEKQVFLQQIVADLRRIRNEMGNAVAEKYGLKKKDVSNENE